MTSHALLSVGFGTMFLACAAGCAGNGSTSSNADGMTSSGGLAGAQSGGQTTGGAEGTAGGASPGGTAGGASPGGTTGGTSETGGAGLADGKGGATPRLETGGESNTVRDIEIGTGGQASSNGGGPMKGETRCGTADEGESVRLSCPAKGEPTVDPAPYKGVANSPANEIAELGATWCYNWKTQPAPSDCADPLFVPMIWGGGNVAGRLSAIAAAGYHTVLGFNEPNKSDQSNMSVADAIAQWPELTSDPNIRVGSPAVSDDGRAWLEDFMAQVEAKGLRVDFIAMHWYGWNKGSCTAGNLRGAVNWASQWGLPVWITEFGCMGSSNTDEATLLRFFGDSISMLQNQPQVERYAWYPWNTYNHLYLADDNKVRQRTALGDAFMNAPPYR